MMVITCLVGCGTEKDIHWYESTLDYFKEGFNNGWKNENSKFFISDELKDSSIKFGYALIDLDGDGIDELLIGIMDGAEETKFTNLIIKHRDFGPTQSFSTGEGYYMYLCDDNIIRMDSWYGSETRTEYMEYDSKNNSFPVIDGGGKPKKVELTGF
jgi:hypothetical protein